MMPAVGKEHIGYFPMQRCFILVILPPRECRFLLELMSTSSLRPRAGRLLGRMGHDGNALSRHISFMQEALI